MHDTTLLEAYPFACRAAEVRSIASASATGSMILQHAAKSKPVFCDAPAVMEYEPMEVRVDVERVLAALSDDRRLACLLVDHTPGLCCFVAGR